MPTQKVTTMPKNIFNSYRKPVRPNAIPAQQLTDHAPRVGTGLKEQALAGVEAITFKPEKAAKPQPIVTPI
jgi:hypothetical protein